MNGIRKTIVIGSALAMMSMSVDAYEFKTRSLQRLILDSSVVAQVEIISSDIFTVGQNQSTVDCGNVYVANVIRSYKGDARQVRFATFARLPIRGKYVVFLTEEYRDGAMMFTSMGAKQEGKYHACMVGGVEMFASMMHGEIYQVEYPQESTDSPTAIRVKTANEPFDGVISAERIEVSSPNLSIEHLDALSYWRIAWSSFEPQLLKLADESRRTSK